MATYYISSNEAAQVIPSPPCVVVGRVLGCRDQFQIVRGVVQAIAVSVMDYLTLKQFSAKHLLHDEPVSGHQSAPRHTNDHVSSPDAGILGACPFRLRNLLLELFPVRMGLPIGPPGGRHSRPLFLGLGLTGKASPPFRPCRYSEMTEPVQDSSSMNSAISGNLLCAARRIFSTKPLAVFQVGDYYSRSHIHILPYILSLRKEA